MQYIFILYFAVFARFSQSGGPMITNFYLLDKGLLNNFYFIFLTILSHAINAISASLISLKMPNFVNLGP